jgi:hypothetical protein
LSATANCSTPWQIADRPAGVSAHWQYLELGDFLLIAEAVTGIPAEVLGSSERVVSQADSALHVPGSGFGDFEAYPGSAVAARGRGGHMCAPADLQCGECPLRHYAWLVSHAVTAAATSGSK